MDARLFGRSFEMNDFERSMVEGEDVGIMAATSLIKELKDKAADLCRSYKMDGLLGNIDALAKSVLDDLPEMAKTPHSHNDDRDDKSGEYMRWLHRSRIDSMRESDDKMVQEFKKKYFELMADFAKELKSKKDRFPWIDAKKIIEPFLTIKMK